MMPGMPGTRFVVALGTGLRLWPGERGSVTTVAPMELHLDRLIVMSAGAIRLPRLDRRWGRSRLIAWASVYARTRTAPSVSLVGLHVGATSRLCLPGSIDATLFAPSSVDCGVDLGVAKAGDTLTAEFRNDGPGPAMIYAHVLVSKVERELPMVGRQGMYP